MQHSLKLILLLAWREADPFARAAAAVDMKRFDNLRSDLTEDEIVRLQGKYSQSKKDSRYKNSELDTYICIQGKDDGLTPNEIYDVKRAGSGMWVNKEWTDYKKSHVKLLKWFDRDAYWSNYQAAK